MPLLRPVIRLTCGLATADVETLTVNAIPLHRQLVEKADQLFQALPEDYTTRKANGGIQHLQYIEHAHGGARVHSQDGLELIRSFLVNVVRQQIE